MKEASFIRKISWQRSIKATIILIGDDHQNLRKRSLLSISRSKSLSKPSTLPKIPVIASAPAFCQESTKSPNNVQWVIQVSFPNPLALWGGEQCLEFYLVTSLKATISLALLGGQWPWQFRIYNFKQLFSNNKLKRPNLASFGTGGGGWALLGTMVLNLN